MCKSVLWGTCLLLLSTSCTLLFNSDGEEVSSDAAIADAGTGPLIRFIENQQLPIRDTAQFIIHGSRFQEGVEVNVGGAPGQITIVESTSERLVVEITVEGTLFGGTAVAVTNPDGQSATLDPGVFFYADTVTMLAPGPSGSAFLATGSVLDTTQIVDLASGDLNQSGNLDIAVAFVGSQPKIVFDGLDESPLGFSSLDFIDTNDQIGVHITDWNQDGFADLTVVGSGDTVEGPAGINVLLGREAPIASWEPLSIGNGAGVVALTSADYNNDGDQEILTIRNLEGKGEIHRSTCTPNSEPCQLSQVSSKLDHGFSESTVNRVESADINGDGFMDLVGLVAGEKQDAKNDFAIIFNENGVLSRDGFQRAMPSGGRIGSLTGAFVADVNLDGKPDLLSLLDTGNTASIFVMINGESGFSEILSNTRISTPDEMAVADFNGDGFPDIWLASSNPTCGNCAVVELYLGGADGRFSFTLSIDLPTPTDVVMQKCVVSGNGKPRRSTHPTELHVADIDADGLVDLGIGPRPVCTAAPTITQTVGVHIFLNTSDQ